MVRPAGERWELAVIRPAGKDGVWALPKGNISRGERAVEAAAREVREETGLDAELVRRVGEAKYVYSWQGERIFKVVSFFLFRYAGGELGALAPEHAHEVAEARWVDLEEAPALLSYGGERELAARALGLLSEAGDSL